MGLTPNYPAKIVPIELSSSKGFIAKSGAIMSSLGDVILSNSTDFNPTTCCCTRMGMCRQGLDGEGTAFLAAGGTVLVKELKEGEKLVVDSESVVAFENTVTFGVMPNVITTCCCGGEGLCNATFEGPGTVITQSMSFSKYVRVLSPPSGAYKQRMDRGLGEDTLDF